MSAPMSLRGGTFSAIYTHRTQTLTMFVQKSWRMHSVACQLWMKKVYVAFLRFELYSQRNIAVGFTNIPWDSLITMRNDVNFLKSIFKLKALCLGIWCCTFFLYLPRHLYIIRLHTYIIGHYNPLVRIIELAFHTTYVVCVNSERLNFWETFSWQFYLLSEVLPKKYFLYFVLMSGLGLEPWL